MNLPPSQQKALEIAAQSLPDSENLFLVGGFVRDALLGRVSADIDLTLPGEPTIALQTARRLANACHSAFPGYRVSPFSLDPDFGIARIVFAPVPENQLEKGFYLDLAVLDGGNIEADLARRDFTVNALALPLAKFLEAGGSLRLEDTIETLGGRADLTEHIIRPIAEQNLLNDPLRMLRGIRLRAQLSSLTARWEFAPGTLELFRKHRALIIRPAAERVREELTKTWIAGDVARSLQLLYSCGLLPRLIPELPLETEADFKAIFNLMNCQEWLLTPPDYLLGSIPEQMQTATRPEDSIDLWQPMLKRLEANGPDRSALLYWAALLYNTVRPANEVMQPEAPDILTQIIQPARQVMARLRFSREATEHVTTIIQQQAQITELEKHFDPANPDALSKRVIYRLLREAGPVQIEALLLALALCGATNSNPATWEKRLALVNLLNHKYMGQDNERLIDQPRLLDGRQLMQLLHVKPGPQIGYILQEIEEAQADGQVKTTEEALELARQLLDTTGL